jgi:hypothetical protein
MNNINSILQRENLLPKFIMQFLLKATSTVSHKQLNYNVVLGYTAGRLILEKHTNSIFRDEDEYSMYAPTSHVVSQPRTSLPSSPP